MKDDKFIKNLKEGQKINYKKIISNEKYQQPPLRYSESTLIKKMEKLGIGRPSTYASIIETIQQREYVKKEDIAGIKKDVINYELSNNKISEKPDKFSIGSEKKKLIPTDIGKSTTKFLGENFEDLMNYSFTSKLEENLDDIVNNKIIWNNMLKTFYSSFEPKVKLLKSSESKNEAYKKKEDSRRNLGINNKKEHVFAYVGKYGPVLQFVDTEDDKKVRFQKLEDYDVNKITLDEVNNMKNAEFPKELGKHEGNEVYLKKGKYGLYLECNKKNYKIINDYDEKITFEQALECLQEKKSNDIANFGEYIVKNGPYGPYILYKSKFYKITGDYVADRLSKTDCIDIVKNYSKSNYKSKSSK